MDVFLEIRKDLRHHSTKKHREASLRFFKEHVNPYGVRHEQMRDLLKKYTPVVREIGAKEYLPVAEKLLADGWFEEGELAIKLMENFEKDYDQTTMKLFEKWVDDYIKNWAHCDWFCTRLVGRLIEKDPSLAAEVVHWTKSRNRWKRRASAVSFVLHARKGRFLDYVFLVAETLLHDKNDMVQKGVGWMLKEATKSNEAEVVEFIRQRKHNMPRTMLRYAIEKLPTKLRKELMEK